MMVSVLYGMASLILLYIAYDVLITIYKRKVHFAKLVYERSLIAKVLLFIFIGIVLYGVSTDGILMQSVDSSLSENANIKFLEINSKLDSIEDKLNESKQTSGFIYPYYFLSFIVILITLLSIFALFIKKIYEKANSSTIIKGTITLGITITISFTLLQIDEFTIYKAGNIHFNSKPREVNETKGVKITEEFLFEKQGEINGFNESEVKVSNTNLKIEKVLNDAISHNLNVKYVLFVGIADKTPLSENAKIKWGSNQALAHSRAISVKNIYLEVIKKSEYEKFRGISFRVIPYGPYNISPNEPKNKRATDRRVDIFFVYERSLL